MAKSGGNACPAELTDLVGVDEFRYYVLLGPPYGSDGDFTVEGLVARYNSDLANNLGNLASRVATVVAKKCGAIGPRRAPTARSPSRAAAYTGAARAGRRRARGRSAQYVVADPRHQRLPRGQQAVEGRTRHTQWTR